jgi:spermidine synthase
MASKRMANPHTVKNAPRVSHPWATVLFAATILLGSALLFLVEPMVAKMLLPSLGGAPAVWNTSLVFFQVLLLAGYAFAHLACARLGLRRLILVQAAVFAVALVALPVGVPSTWIPDTSMPVRWTLAALVAAVGLPFFALATVSPMLQRWYSHTNQQQAADPYFLYSASNAGSLIGLAGYPLAVEPSFALADQARLWGGLFGLLAFLIVASGVTTFRLRQPVLAADGMPPSADEAERPATTPPAHRRRQRLRWVALAAIPSALMLGVTHHLTTDIASLPLIWVIPLALYLMTFIVAFGANPPWLRLGAGYAVKLLVIPLALTLFGFAPVGLDLALGLIVFTAAALLAHGELAASRPPVERLTEFYLLISLGGALGGTLTAILAPLVFPVVLEYPLAVAAALMVLPVRAFSRRRGASRGAGIALGLGSVALVPAIVFALAPADSALWIALAATVGVAVLVMASRPAHFAIGIGLLLVVVPVHSVPGSIHLNRSFFGTIEIRDVDGFREVRNGSTVHGSQALDPALARHPTTYYHRNGPLGDLFARRVAGVPHAVAVVGLGAGSIATYGRPGDRHVFLEIDPLVARVASDPRYFTYLEDTQADLEIRLGDGRLLLESTDERFDLIVLDAFTSDAIPVHLMTLEAMASYLEHLSPGGVVAYHVSNRHTELRPVLARQARELGLAMIAIDDGVSPEDAATGKWPATWVAIARTPAELGPLELRWSKPEAGDAPLWTDTYSNLVQVLELW